MIDPNDIVKSMQIDSLTADEQMQLLSGIEKSIKNSRVQRQEAVKGNVDVVINLLKKIEGDIRSRYDEVGNRLESHFSSMAEGKDGKDGKDGLQGAKGADGRDGVAGRDGVDGQNGEDGTDGVSVTDAKIDFDGSLVITLSNGREMNVGEVVAPDLAERIKVISTMSTNASLTIQDEGGTITSGARTINFTGAGVTATASGDSVTVAVTGGGGAAVSSFSAGTTGFTPNTATTGAIVLAGTLAAANGGTGATSLAGASIVTYTGVETLTNKTFTGYTETVFALGTSGSLALNPANGTIQTCALTGNPTFTDSLAAGQSLILMLENGASYTVTFPTITWVTSGGNVAPTLTADDTLVFWKISTTLYGAYVGSYA